MAVTVPLNSLIYPLLVLIIIVYEAVPYKTISLEESRLCKLRPEDPEASIYLEKERGSSRIVTQETYFAEWTGRFDFRCSFSVTAPNNYGVYAVVQVLNFRKNETTGKCKDYVRFYVPQNFVTALIGRKNHEKYVCGRVYAAQNYQPHSSNGSSPRYGVSPVADNGFKAPDGHMHVTIYVAQQRLSKDEKLDIKIAFTSYKRDCGDRPRHILCTRCEWIWEGLAGDGVQNCPYTSCLDENYCSGVSTPFEIHDIISKETGTKVTVVAISAIMITFFIFAICLCACRRSQRCCWKPANHPVRVEMSRTRPEELVTTFREQPPVLPPPTPPDGMSPSAPPLNDKDVPPSYESLFPSK